MNSNSGSGHYSRFGGANGGGLGPNPSASGQSHYRHSSSSSPHIAAGGRGDGSRSGHSLHRDMQHQFDENDEQVHGLASRISVLKQISVDIGDEVQYQNKLLTEMESDFGKAGDLLSYAMRRFKIMAKTQTGGWMWIILGFMMTVFFYIYFFRMR